MNLALLVVAVLVTAGWTPILVRFVRAWRARNNPISLAIAVVVLFLMWAGSMLVWWLVARPFSSQKLAAGLVGLNVVVCANFHVALYWSKSRFPDSRR